ncbi:DUF421 domain-containing protein [Pseudalkalibacillus caeni]|uniref:DUF421 domain-containing protein n=1 Tax=Exobacillus caeni TaxID=2574798 RepID=A0A5R9F6A1_9BACL|nr:DUF421 domain-containing protein [Pseudalkalibacillus caeni]TLS39272.1 DUF421 domain-containing protein [Pseudalkalibacillus caeni]
MEFLTIILRTVVLYYAIIVIFRLMGKREIGQLSILDFVVSIMIAELAVLSIEDPKTPMVNTLVPMGILVLIQIAMAFISLKSEKMRELIDGKPSVLIDRGKIDEEEMKKQRYNFDDLLAQLRQKDVASVSDVEFAILEPSGDLSVIKKEKNNKEIKAEELLPLPLILDGKVQEEHLKKINKTSLWLRQELKKLGHRDIKRISFCSLHRNGTFFIDLKNEK